jgi:hypothetical protein
MTDLRGQELSLRSKVRGINPKEIELPNANPKRAGRRFLLTFHDQLELSLA